jgi:putative effector of murein hydrolase LrgA (UPF0299 family)
MKITDIIIIFDLDVNYYIRHIIVLLAFFSMSQIISAILVCLIFKTLKKHAHKFSTNTYRMHIQFSLLSTAQLLSPVIFMFIPCSAAVISYLIGYYATETQDQIGILGIVLYGASSSFLTIGRVFNIIQIISV